MIRPIVLRLGAVVCALYAACGGSSDGGPASAVPTQLRVPSNDPGAPEMVDLTIRSRALGRDAHARLLLPLAFDEQPTRRWPVLYLLHGANEPLGYRAWTEQTRIETLAMAHDMIVVMPEAGQAGWYSDWAGQCNPGAGADAAVSDAGAVLDAQPGWETFHLGELAELLRTQFRASDKLAIAGLSMGGMGATSYAGRHPGMFAAVASYSGALRTSSAAVVVSLSLQIAGCRNTDAIWGSPQTQASVWAEHDPYLLAAALTDIPVYVSVGNGAAGPLDPAGTSIDTLEALAEGVNQQFVDQLRQLGGGAKLSTHFYGRGTHSWPYWARELEASFPMLVAALDD
jgi:diacylglycerol O-acyltransferase / trehalose O-mycolyltransferase